MAKHTPNQAAFQALIKQHSKASIARMIGSTKQYISNWDEVPIKYVRTISKITGIPPHTILPDPYIEGEIVRRPNLPKKRELRKSPT